MITLCVNINMHGSFLDVTVGNKQHPLAVLARCVCCFSAWLFESYPCSYMRTPKLSSQIFFCPLYFSHHFCALCALFLALYKE